MSWASPFHGIFAMSEHLFSVQIYVLTSLSVIQFVSQKNINDTYHS